MRSRVDSHLVIAGAGLIIVLGVLGAGGRLTTAEFWLMLFGILVMVGAGIHWLLSRFPSDRVAAGRFGRDPETARMRSHDSASRKRGPATPRGYSVGFIVILIATLIVLRLFNLSAAASLVLAPVLAIAFGLLLRLFGRVPHR